jgi:hypothetical protein
MKIWLKNGMPAEHCPGRGLTPSLMSGEQQYIDSSQHPLTRNLTVGNQSSGLFTLTITKSIIGLRIIFLGKDLLFDYFCRYSIYLLNAYIANQSSRQQCAFGCLRSIYKYTFRLTQWMNRNVTKDD